LLAHLAEHVKFERVALVRLVVDMFEFDSAPGFKATPMYKPSSAHASARSHVLETVVLLLVPAEAALDLESGALDVQVLMVDEPPVSHPFAIIFYYN